MIVQPRIITKPRGPALTRPQRYAHVCDYVLLLRGETASRQRQPTGDLLLAELSQDSATGTCSAWKMFLEVICCDCLLREK